METIALTSTDTMSEAYRVYFPYTELGYKWHSVKDDPHFFLDPTKNGILSLQRIYFPDKREDRIQGTIKMVKSFQRAGYKVIAEFDDDFTSIPVFNGGYWGSHVQYVEAYEAMCRVVDSILVSTRFLASRVARFNPHVSYIENRILPSMWTPGTSRDVGVRGSASHMLDWRYVPEIWESIRQAFPETTFRTLGFNPNYLTIPHKSGSCKWYELPHYLDKIGILIAPLDGSNIFNLSKSCCAFYEGSMAGAATIAQNCIPYSEEIIHGETGFLASTPKEFAEYGKMLLADPDLRDKIAQQARQWVLENRNVFTDSHLWKEYYDKVRYS